MVSLVLLKTIFPYVSGDCVSLIEMLQEAVLFPSSDVTVTTEEPATFPNISHDNAFGVKETLELLVLHVTFLFVAPAGDILAFSVAVSPLLIDKEFCESEIESTLIVSLDGLTITFVFDEIIL